MADRFNSMLYGVDGDIKRILQNLPVAVKEKTEEIRLREGLPLALTISGETVFVKRDGQTSKTLAENLFAVSQNDIKQSFRLLCNNSAFAHENELKNGYIRLKNGNRAGVFGTVNDEGYMENITCINIRIAREIKGVATRLVSGFRGEGWLIAGPPGSGKTTVLRDFVRQISNGFYDKSYRVAVIDSRGELGGNGVNDLGISTDIINTEDKAKGIEIAIRTMNPQVIAFDEIGSLTELKRVKDGFNAGVTVITTVHVGDKSELLKRPVTRQLLMSGITEKIAMLSHFCRGEVEIMTLRELKNGNF